MYKIEGMCAAVSPLLTKGFGGPEILLTPARSLVPTLRGSAEREVWRFSPHVRRCSVPAAGLVRLLAGRSAANRYTPRIEQKVSQSGLRPHPIIPLGRGNEMATAEKLLFLWRGVEGLADLARLRLVLEVLLLVGACARLRSG